MRIFAALLLFGLASEGWAEADISEMLACNPNDENKKPVIYAFDGAYLSINAPFCCKSLVFVQMPF
tara:strand:- start:398 stop:595 length:198 start_codon:yes stop_codon:yes gene_type:complete